MKRAIAIFACFLIGAAISSQEMRIITEDWAPYNYSADGILTGLSVEIVHAILDELELSAPIELFPGLRAKEMFDHETRIIMITLYRTPEREGLYKWVGPIDTGAIYLYQREENPAVYYTLEDAKTARGICCRNGGLIRDLLLLNGFTNLLDFAGDSVQVYNMLLSGRGELGISDTDLGVTHYLKLMGVPPSALKRTGVKVFESDLYIAFSKDFSEETVALWQDALNALKQNGTYDVLYRKYAAELPATEE